MHYGCYIAPMDGRIQHTPAGTSSYSPSQASYDDQSMTISFSANAQTPHNTSPTYSSSMYMNSHSPDQMSFPHTPPSAFPQQQSPTAPYSHHHAVLASYSNQPSDMALGINPVQLTLNYRPRRVLTRRQVRAAQEEEAMRLAMSSASPGQSSPLPAQAAEQNDQVSCSMS